MSGRGCVVLCESVELKSAAGRVSEGEILGQARQYSLPLTFRPGKSIKKTLNNALFPLTRRCCSKFRLHSSDGGGERYTMFPFYIPFSIEFVYL